MFLFYLKDGDLMEELKKKNVFEEGSSSYLDKKKISPELFLEEQELFIEYGMNHSNVHKHMHITSLSKNGEMYNPDTGTNVYGQTIHVSKGRIKPTADNDKVNVEMYVEFRPKLYGNDVRHCYLTLPKEDMYESKNCEGDYYFYLREPEVELNSLDNKGEKFKVESNYITLFHPIGEHIHEMQEKEKLERKKKDVEHLAETLKDKGSIDYELE